jgi:2-polyprenyl-3-methyl-5-hydroxy-6-metoxy-1,4-benzoquinol methylase
MCGSPAARILLERPLRGDRWLLARCRACGLHFTAPTPTDTQLHAFYEGDYHESLRAAGATEAAFRSKFERYADALGRHLPSGRVIDIGCSTGLLVRILRDRGYQAEGIELNPQSADWGRTHYGIPIHAQPIEACGFPPASLNAIVMADVLEHTRHPRDYLKSLGRLLAPGGFALITFPDIRSVESRYHALLSGMLNREWLWSSCHVPLHVWEFTRPTAEACFGSAGFQVVEFRRHQAHTDDRDSALTLRLLNAPLQPLHWPVVRGLFGSQMEFVIRKTTTA